MAEVIQSTLRYDADLSSAMAQVKALTGQIATLNAAFVSLDTAANKTRASLANAFMTNVSGMGGFTSKMVEMTSATDNFGKALQRNKLTMSQYFAEAYRGLTKQDSMMRQYARQQARYMESITVPMGTGPNGRSMAAVFTPSDIDMRNMTTKMNVMNQQFNTFRHLVNQGSQEMINFGKNTQWTGRQLTVGLTMPVLLFSSTFAKAFMDIDKELTRFAKVYGEDLVNSNQQATERMKEQVIDLAKTISSQFGVAAKETTALAADVAATGKTGQDLLDTVSQTTRLAVLGEVDRQEAMKATLAIQSAFRQNTDELAESINFLNAIENQTSTTLNDLVEAIPKAGPVIKGLGGSIKDLSVLMVAMKEGGIPAAEAANAIKSGMASLINPTKKASETAKQFGVDLVGIVNANKGQLMPTLFAVQNALSGLSDFAKSRVIEEIFGKYQFARISALFNNLGRAGSQTQQAMELAGASTVELATIANKELKAYAESTTVRFQRMMETVKNQLLPVGQALLEGLIPVLEKVSGAIDTIGGIFKNLPDPVKNFGKILGGLALVAGPVLMLVGLFKQLIGNGLKAAMSVVTLGARLGGIKVGPLEHLDEQAVAANAQIKNLTQSFMTQEQAVNGLNKQMAIYLSALRQAAATNPAMFAPPVGGRAPIRRATGGDVPGGYGGGDKIPALLEPGEFVVRKEAANKYRPILDSMNAGTIAGFQEGTPSRQLSHITGGSILVPIQRLIDATFGRAKRILEEQKKADVTHVRTFNNLVVALDTAVNQNLDKAKSGAGVQRQILAKQLAEMDRWTLMAKATGLRLEELEPVVKRLAGAIDRSSKEILFDADMFRIVGKELAVIAKSGGADAVAASRLLALSQQYGTYEYQRTEESKSKGRTVTRPGRESLGVRAVGAGSYRGSRLATGSAMRPFLDLTSGEWMQLGEDGVVRVLNGFTTGVRKGTQTQSPSKEAERIGLDYAAGLNNGIRSGLRGGPVGAGYESRDFSGIQSQALRSESNIESKRQAIVARRVRAEVERAALMDQIVQISKKQASGEISAQEALRQRIAITREITNQEKIISDAKTKEARLSKLIEDATARRLAAEQRLATPQATGGRFGHMTPEERKALAAARRNEYLASVGGEGGADRTGRGRMTSFSSGATNAAFGLSMALSTITMFGDQTSEATANLQKFSMGLMTVSSMMMMMQGSGMGGLLGKATGGIAGLGGRMAASGGALARFAPLLTAGAGAAPLAIGAAAITAGVTAFILYKNAAEEARQRAVAAFADPAKSAEYFGKKIKSVKDAFAELNLKNIGVDAQKIDQALRDAVKEDYAPLIEKIKYSSAEGGAKELGVAFNKMLLSGLSGDEAKAAIEAIALESGARGAEAMKLGLENNIFNADMTNAERIAAIADSYDPKKNPTLQATLKKSAENAQSTLEEARNAYAKRGGDMAALALAPLLPDFMLDKDLKNIKELANAADQMNEIVLEASDVTSAGLISMAEQMSQAFKLDPSAAILAFDQVADAGRAIDKVAFDLETVKNYLKEIDPLSGQALEEFIDSAEKMGEGGGEKMSKAILRALSAGISPQEIARILAENAGDAGALNVEVNVNITYQNAVNALEEAKTKLKDALLEDLDGELKKSQKAYEEAQQNVTEYADDRAKVKDILEEQFQTEQEGIQESIEGMQDQIDVINDVTDKKREQAEEAIDALQEEKDQITEVTDNYLDSIRKRADADNFYANQRKSNMSALGKLASGDVFGFLVDREAMQGEATQYAYDEEIKKIEENRDAQVEAIDTAIEKKQEEVEEFEKAQKRKIDAIQDEIDKQQDLLDANQKTHDQRMEDFDEATEKHQTHLEEIVITRRNKNAEIQRLIQSATNNQLASEEDLTEALGEEKAKQYADAQKSILKQMYLVEIARQQQAGETIDRKKAIELIKPFFDQAVPGFFSSGPGRRDINTEIANFLGIDLTTGRAEGGYISGPGGPTDDKIPAYLSNGEYVIRASSVNKYGKKFFDRLNAKNFADGGPVEMKKQFDSLFGSDVKYHGSWDSKGEWPGGYPYGVLMHHTGPPNSDVHVDNMKNGWDGMRGPIVQSVLSRDGTLHILAYGGQPGGTWQGGSNWVRGGAGDAGSGWRDKVPEEMARLFDTFGTGKNGGANRTMFQMEVIDSGDEPTENAKTFTSAQMTSIGKALVALKRFSKWNSLSGRVINHSDWAVGRKGDTNYPVSTFISSADSVDGGASGGSGSGSGTGSGSSSGSGTGATTTTTTSIQYGNRIRSAFEDYRNGRKIVGGALASFIGQPMLGKIVRTTQTPPSTDGPPSSPTPNQPSNDELSEAQTKANAIVALARRHQNIPYGFEIPDLDEVPSRWGCATSVAWIYHNAAGIRLPSMSMSNDQYHGLERSVSANNMKPGDLIFYYNKNGVNRQNKVNHVEMYLGNGDVFNGGKGIRDGLANYPVVGIKRALKYATGGHITGPGGPKDDKIPAWLSNGEYVIKADSVSKYGKAMMDSINAGMFGMGGMAKKFNMPKYAIGGPVGKIPNVSGMGGSDMSITIHANGISDPEVFAKKVVNLIDRKKSQREHARMVRS